MVSAGIMIMPPSSPRLLRPFRDAVESSPQFGDRRSPLDSANAQEALREVALDMKKAPTCW
jgi:delta-aminolevulinic acid dehydratase/porphobilinogen synthase